MSQTRVRRDLNAPRAKVYRALIDPDAIARWKFPDGMAIRVHALMALAKLAALVESR